MRNVILCLVTLALVALLCTPTEARPIRDMLFGGASSSGCPNCPKEETCSVPVTITVEIAESVSEAAKKLAKGGLGKAEEKRLSDIVNEPAREKARAGHYAPGSCNMLGCKTHPEQWVWDDEESQAETDARTIPWSGSGRLRIFRGRR